MVTELGGIFNLPAGRQALNYELAMHKYISFIIEDWMFTWVPANQKAPDLSGALSLNQNYFTICLLLLYYPLERVYWYSRLQ